VQKAGRLGKMLQLQMKLLRKKIEKWNTKLWQQNIQLQEASDTSLSQPQNGHVPKETGKGGKAKKALKGSVPVDSAEAQSGDMPEETLENAKVKKSPL
jgi:ATP-dependent RNA helicase DDX18/HAS1